MPKLLVLFFISQFGSLFGQNDLVDTLRDQNHQSYFTDKSYTELLILFGKREIHPGDNNVTFLVLDSIVRSNVESQVQQRIKAFTAIAKQSDGALSEVMGIYSFSYLNNKPKEFYLLLTHSDENKLAETIQLFCAFEVYASGDKAMIGESKSKVKANKKLLPVEKEYLLFFLEQVKATSILLK